MARDAVTIKGTSDGLVITLGEGPLEAVLEEMEARLSSSASFFVGGRVALRVGDRALSSEQLQNLGAVLEQAGVTLWAVEGVHPFTRVAAQRLGLETRLRAPAVAVAEPAQITREEVPGLLVQRTLRSGQALRHPGHVTLIGDVNPGGELVAGGDVVVWGALRGTVHAGAMGDDGAIVCALQLAPSQIRIGTYIARPPERGRPPALPEIARVYEGRIVVERWNAEKPPKLAIKGWQVGIQELNRRLKALFGPR